MRKVVLLSLIFLLCACKERPSRYNGYIDADLTYLSSNFAGRLEHLFVVRGQTIQKNQLLFQLEQTSERDGVAISQLNKKSLQSQRKEILSQIQYVETNYHRTLRMRKQDAASQNDLDVAKKDLDVLKNQLNAIEFHIKSSGVDIAQKTWQVEKKESHAPNTGIIFDTYFTENEYVQAGQPVLSLLTKDQIKVIFFVPEAELSHLRLNEKVTLSTDDNLNFASGTISYIANIAQYTPPMIYSREDRENLVFRIEARLDNPSLNKVHLGQPVSLEFTR